MDPYAKPKERKVGVNRPKVRHLPQSSEPRTRREREAEKEAVGAERRAIKKRARRHLKQRLLKELGERVNGFGMSARRSSRRNHAYLKRGFASPLSERGED
jgi:hypothetical protein